MGVEYQFDLEFSRALTPHQRDDFLSYITEYQTLDAADCGRQDYYQIARFHKSYSNLASIDEWLDDFTARYELSARYNWTLDGEQNVSWLGKDVEADRSAYAREEIMGLLGLLTDPADIQAILNELQAKLTSLNA